MRATSPDCYALALRLVGNEHDARDVLQDTYLRAFRSLRKFRGESSYATWLHRITVNCSATFVAKRQQSAHLELDDEIEVLELRAGSDPETVADAADDRQRLVHALAGLPDQMRMVVVLRDVYDMAHEEIARELGISQTAAKVRLHRARRRLRELLFVVPTPAGTQIRSRSRGLVPAAVRGEAVIAARAVAGLRGEARTRSAEHLEEADVHAAAV